MENSTYTEEITGITGRHETAKKKTQKTNDNTQIVKYICEKKTFFLLLITHKK